MLNLYSFFFQAEDGIRAHCVTGVQTCALPIFFPAVRTGGSKRETLRGAQDADRLEVRGLEQNLSSLVADLALLAAHDGGEGDRPLAVRDHEIARFEPAERAVERSELLARPRATNNDPPAREPCAVEGVQRASPDVHHVVRDV